LSTIQNWSTTAASNTSIDSIDIAENCSPANLNNAARASMANIAALRDLMGAAATTGGSANAQTLTSGLTLTAYQQGLLIGFEAGYSNSGAATLNVDGVGAVAIKTPAGADLTSGMITAGGIYLAAYESGAGVFILIGAAANELTATLEAIGDLTPTDSNIIVGNGTTWVAESGATARTSIGLGPGDSPQFTAVNIGAATDTTVTRVSAGVIAVEGATILTTATGAPIPTSSTLPVGFCGFMRYTSSSSLSDGSTTSGSNVQTLAFSGNFGTTGLGVRAGATQSGTWKNISGVTLSSSSLDNSNAVGLMVRTV